MRVLIADDFELMRDGIRSLLTRQGWDVCGTAVTGREAVEKAQALRPEVAVLDISMPQLDGLEATRQIRNSNLGTEVLILTAHEDDQPIRDALDAGAKGYLFKSEAATQLVDGIKTVAKSGRGWGGPSNATGFRIDRTTLSVDGIVFLTCLRGFACFGPPRGAGWNRPVRWSQSRGDL